MKNLFLPLLLLFAFTSISAQVAYRSFLFHSQEQLDSFEPTAIIYGDVTISGKGINDLTNLLATVSITGSLTLNGTSLENLNGLINLNFVGGDLIVGSNPNLRDLDGLQSLLLVSGNVEIVGNKNLLHLDAFQKLSKIYQSLTVSHNDLLGDLNGLTNLYSVGHDFDIQQNAQLSDCCAVTDLLNNGGVKNLTLILDNQLGCSEVAEVIKGCLPIQTGLQIASPFEKTKQLNIFPNPASDHFTVSVPDGFEKGSITVIDMRGREITNQKMVESSSHYQFELGSLPSGIYLVVFRAAGHPTVVNKLMIEK